MSSGARVALREIAAEDTPLIVAWRNKPAVRDNFVWRGEMTEELHSAWLRDKVGTGQVAQFIIEAGPRRQPVGSVYLRDINREHRRAEFGIFIGEESWQGCGVGTEAARLALHHGFCVLGLSQIYLRVYRRNTGAVRSYEKAGFTALNEPPPFLEAGADTGLLFMQIGKEEFLEAGR